MTAREGAWAAAAAAGAVALACAVTGGGAGGGAAPASVPAAPSAAGAAFAGSGSCRECHERFYSLWEPSHHGKAMQPFTPEFARRELRPASNDIVVAGSRFRYGADERGGWVAETRPDGSMTNYPILHAMGGKNVYYFLTPLERGRLQVMPVAYNVVSQAWYNTTGSMIRHFRDGVEDAPLDWRDSMLTFNTACHDCHVSQLTRNYDAATDSYRTTWQEPGINCETCHGSAVEHVRVCREAPKGTVPADIRIISTRPMTPDQRDSLCAPCHAKMVVLTDTFLPGEDYFDHYDLVGLEHPDFYPDGRDLGENYTYTTWLMSPCLRAEQMECIHCHTSSGRYRFRTGEPNAACLPCHAERVANAPAHTHHKPGQKGNTCIGCHMPVTSFAAMRRSDHSLRPPTPAATLAFGSPNACNICHADKDAAWADRHVRAWHTNDYQAPVLAVARLVDDARRQRWERLPAILAYLEAPGRDAVVAASLLRLLAPCEDPRRRAAALRQLADPLPLVRAAAVDALEFDGDPSVVAPLLKAARDPRRLVRIKAANALVGRPIEGAAAEDRRACAAALAEYRKSLTIWADRWSSHYNLGNFLDRSGQPREALAAYAQATRLRPDVVGPLVNAAVIHARLDEAPAARRLLQQALQVDPRDGGVNFNLGLAEAEAGDLAAAERHLRAALKADPRMAPAAHNLGVLLSQKGVPEGLVWSRRAVELAPREGRYAYTYAFYLAGRERLDEAAAVLTAAIAAAPGYADSYWLLGDILARRNRPAEAAALYRRMEGVAELPAADRQRAAALRRRLEGAGN